VASVEAALSRRVIPVYRPKRNTIALVAPDLDHVAVEWSVADARAFHDMLGAALHLAECAPSPRLAVDGAA
jgi:hypothetical protein